MKRIIFYIFISLFLYDSGYAGSCSDRFPDINCGVEAFSSLEEAESAQIGCAKITTFAGITPWPYYMICPEISSETDTWAFYSLPPYGGCAQPQENMYVCHYYKVELEEECCDKEAPKSGQKCPNPFVGNPISVLSGYNKETVTDLQFPTSFEKGFQIYRTYKSRRELDSPLGYGWNHSYHVTLEYLGPPEIDAYRISDESGKNHHFVDNDGDGTYNGMTSTKGYLETNDDDTITWHRSNGIKYTFDQLLRYITREDGNGNLQTLTYDTTNRLETVSDQSTGRSIGFTYNADGRIEHITGPVTTAVSDGIWVTYQYDTEGNLTHVIYADDANGSTASGFEYKYEDPNDPHNITEKRNLAGKFISSWVYDSEDRAYDNVHWEGKGVTISGFGTSSRIVTDAQGVEKTYTIEKINGLDTITNISGGGCSSCGGDAVRYGYDDQRRVNEVEQANGRIDQYTDFDATDRYHTEIKAAGTVDERTFHYTYHPVTGDHLTITESSILGGGDKETVFDYDNDGNDTPNENPTRLMYRKIERGFTYDAAGDVTPFEHITLYTYNTKGQVETVDGPLPGDQDKVVYTYYPVTGDLHTETRPLVGTTTYSYDDAGNVDSITDVNNTVTTIAYDGRNRQLSTTRNGVTTSRTYTAAGELDTTTDALNRTMDYTYNTAGFMEKIIDPSGNFMYYGYNAIGQREEQSIFAADNTQTHFSGTDYGDPANNPDLPPAKAWKSIRRNHDDSADLETTYAYDDAGNLKSVTDAKGNITTYIYDQFDRLYQVIQPGDATTTYTYDTHGNLDTVTDAEGHVTIYTYDDLDRLVSTDSPDTGITRYNYDETGNLRFKVKNNNTIEYRYDLLSRLTHILYSDAAQNVTMTYDTSLGAIGRLATVTDPSGFVEYNYDADGQVEMETRTINGVAFVTGYDYDAAGNLRTITYPTGHTIDYQPDATDPALIGGVLLDGSQSLAANIIYAPFGPVKTMTLGNGLQTVKTYDKNYQIRSNTAGAAMDRTYTPDDVGNIEVITDNLDATRSQSFDYDNLYRLTDANGVYGAIGFTYDKVGNRLSRNRTGAATAQDTYHYYPDTNRLQTVVGTHGELIDYDADGNITTRTPASGNTVPSITDPADYTYNSSGQRSIKDATGDKIFHYDLSGQLIAETDGLGNLIKAYIWLHGQPLAQIVTGGGIYYYHNDHLGTPQKMTDDAGQVVWAADYLPFGQTDVIVATVENNLRFKGQYYDAETGLHYNYHRYYDPSLGRYLRADPIGLVGGINPYVYVQNNPINWIDREGLMGSNPGVDPGPSPSNPEVHHGSSLITKPKHCPPYYRVSSWSVGWFYVATVEGLIPLRREKVVEDSKCKLWVICYYSGDIVTKVDWGDKTNWRAIHFDRRLDIKKTKEGCCEK